MVGARARGKVRRATRSRAADRRRMPLVGAPSATSARAQRLQADAIQVAVTVDDLPAHGPPLPGAGRLAVVETLLAAFAAHELPAVHGFVNGKLVNDNPALEVVLRRWVAAGQQLGNHSWSHPSLNSTSLEVYLADIRRDEDILDRVAPRDAWKVFRYPFLQEGDTTEKRDGVRRFLAQQATPSPRSPSTPTTGPTIRRSSAVRSAGTKRRWPPAALVRHWARRGASANPGHHAHARGARRPTGAVAARRRGRRGVHRRSLDGVRSGRGAVGRVARGACGPVLFPGDARAGSVRMALPYVLGRERGLEIDPPVWARGLEARLDTICR